MNIPNFVPTKFVDVNLFLSSAWQMWFSQVITELQKNVGQYGFYPTQLTTTEIAALPVATTEGAIVYDITTQQFKRNIAGAGFTVF
jgi:hypothetical protein